MTHSSGVLYNYNTSTGYFRPYSWPTGEKDLQKYLEFTLIPLNNSTVELNKLTINHKPNTVRLGPSKMGLSYSLDGGETYEDLPDQVIVNRSEFNNSVFAFQDFVSKLPVQIRLYAFESLQGTETERDFWIIDNIELYGGVSAITSNALIKTNNPYNCFYSFGKLHIKGINETTNLRIFNLLGMEVMQMELKNDIIIDAQFYEPLLLLSFENKHERRTVKVHRL